MASEMDRATETTLALLQTGACALDFPDLVRCVVKETSLDEATVKASILRLNSDGQVEITLDWTVRPSRMRIELPAVAAA
jgi:hypothetical protein